ncbi:hypothetical protein C8R44DRAFT_798081 [Mycena epipterygia]|nr:hypothetical protein C8R44DRAFT_798081 [Mycena epipterygia]
MPGCVRVWCKSTISVCVMLSKLRSCYKIDCSICRVCGSMRGRERLRLRYAERVKVHAATKTMSSRRIFG